MFNIFLDSNILYQDYFFENKSNKQILYYASGGLINVYISRIVILELREQYIAELDAINKMNLKSNKLLNRWKQEKTFAQIDLKEAQLQFDDFYEHLGNSHLNFHIVEVKDHYLSDLIERAVKKIKPFGENKSEVKDALIWKSYSELVELNDINDCILLTKNVTDFCNKKDRSKVHDDLLSDSMRFEVIDSSYDYIKKYVSRLDSYASSITACFNLNEAKKVSALASLDVDEDFVLQALNQNFRNEIEIEIDEFIENLSPHDVFSFEGFIPEGHVSAFFVEINDCSNIEKEYLSNSILVYGTIKVEYSGEVFLDNIMRERGDDYFISGGEAGLIFALQFNITVNNDGFCRDLEVSSICLSEVI